MPVKTTGIEFKRFYSDPQIWREGVFHDDTEFTVNDVTFEDDISTVADDAIITISGGFLSNDANEVLGSFERVFKKWKKNQSIRTLVVEVPNESADEFQAIIKLLGCKIIL